jgi:hypothetical protein
MELRCKDPSATVRAANVRATLDAFNLVPSVGKRLVEKHHLAVGDLQPDKMVLVQSWLDALAEIATAAGPEVVRAVGAAIVENADFPRELDSVEAVLLALDTIYQHNHKGDVGHYHSRKLDDGSFEVRCETPYPRQFERGLVEGIARHARLTKGQRYGVQYLEGDGKDVTCTLVVLQKR